MARLFLTPIDLAQLELLNPRAQNLAVAPSSPVAGQFYYDTVLLMLRWWDGSQWNNAVSGSGAPSGAAGGDLSGTYPNPSIGTGVIVNADINASAAIALSKLATDPLARANHTGTQSADTLTDGTTMKAYLAAERTKLSGIDVAATANLPDATLLARANHTGTQLAATISNFDTTVRLNRIDQLAAAGADVAHGGFKITGLGTPTADTDAATKGYVDGLALGVAWKESARVNALTNITISGPGASVDGVTMVAGDRVLLSGQTLPAANGLYLWNGAAAAMTRTTDADTVGDLSGAAVFINEGTSADTGWVLTTEVVTVGTTAQTWTQFTGLGLVTAGTGLTKTGNTIDVIAGTGIVVNANDVAIDPAVVARKFSADCAAATSTVVTHNLATRDVSVSVIRTTTPWEEVECDTERTTTNTVTVRFAVAPTAAQYRITVIG